MKAIIFAGPSLPPAHRPVLPGIDWRPPARQGDVYSAALERPAIIGVVDGVFEVVPTVWHKEILWAMAQGIHVYGAASIGALRAAELDSFGMVGIGRVYEAFRDGVLQDDDEVALLHGPEGVDYAPLTEAMVNVRATLECVVAAHIIRQDTAVRLCACAKGIFYKKRTWPRLLEQVRHNSRRPPNDPCRRSVELGCDVDHSATRGAIVEVTRPTIEAKFAPTGQSTAETSALADQLSHLLVDQKRRDACAMTAAIIRHIIAGVSPLAAGGSFVHTAAWEAALRSGTSVTARPNLVY